MGRTVWPYIANSTRRTDLAFKNFYYDGVHQQSVSPLSELQMGLVTQVPLDYLHLLCLGVMKKLIRIWVHKGVRKCKLPSHKIDVISQMLQTYSQYMPKEFVRKPRPVTCFKFWKATEFRSFLFYFGPVVLRKVLPKEFYRLFYFYTQLFIY